jgi:hypothetical protein
MEVGSRNAPERVTRSPGTPLPGPGTRTAPNAAVRPSPHAERREPLVRRLRTAQPGVGRARRVGTDTLPVTGA